MVFALGSGDLRDIALLRKPMDHKNPLFRNRWTVPGGKIEDGESDAYGAARELLEEAALLVDPESLVYVLTFACNCDPTEPEHQVVVFAVRIHIDKLIGAFGQPGEPVMVCRELPAELLWYIEPLLALVRFRLKQPVPANETGGSSEASPAGKK